MPGLVCDVAGHVAQRHLARCRAPSPLVRLRVLPALFAPAAPNHLKAIWKVFVAENPLFKNLFKLEIGFAVRGWGVAGFRGSGFSALPLLAGVHCRGLSLGPETEHCPRKR